MKREVNKVMVKAVYIENELGEYQVVKQYADMNQFELVKIQETQDIRKTPWHERELGRIVKSTLKKGDYLIAFDVPSLVRSNKQMLTLCRELMFRGVFL